MTKTNQLELKSNQAALILEVTDKGEISVDIHSDTTEGLPYDICMAIAKKLLYDEKFQVELMEIVDENEASAGHQED